MRNSLHETGPRPLLENADASITAGNQVLSPCIFVPGNSNNLSVLRSPAKGHPVWLHSCNAASAFFTKGLGPRHVKTVSHCTGSEGRIRSFKS